MNRRIQKKRAKAAWERDKSTVIANFLVWMDPDAERAEYLRCAAALWKLDKDTLFQRIDEMMNQRMRWYGSPIRILPTPKIRLEAAEEG